MALATVAIISIGDMGVGIARMLLANNFRVITNCSERRLVSHQSELERKIDRSDSPATQERAAKNNIELSGSDGEMCDAADYVLSIVPPKDAVATAERIAKAFKSRTRKRSHPLCYIDLNAISPRSARGIHDLLFKLSPEIKYIDGGIMGGPPKQQTDGSFQRPSIAVSGPHKLVDIEPNGAQLQNTLNVRHVNETIGSATGLKMCFASLSKGFTALAIQSYTTAKNLGVLDDLKAELDGYMPGVRGRAEKGMTGMPPKAYRWINEMEQIAETHEADGGFRSEESIFRSIAQVYDLVKESELGKEVTESRVHGQTAEDVAVLMMEATDRRKLKKE